MRISRNLFTGIALALCFMLPAAVAHAAPVVTGSTDALDDVNDLAGLLVYSPPSSSTPSSTQGTLYVQSSNQGGVLSALSATQSDSSHFQADIDSTTVTFTVVAADFPALYLPVPTLICQNQWVKVYANARCLLKRAAFTTGCLPLFPNRSVIATYAATTQCVRGTGFCVEFYRPWEFLSIYNNNFCGGAAQTSIINNWLC